MPPQVLAPTKEESVTPLPGLAAEGPEKAEETAGIGVVLLAAGESTRMDWLKQLLDWHGMPLIQYQVLELQATTVQELLVVLGHRAEHIQPVVDEVLDRRRGRVVVNPDYRKGKTTSIKAGLRNFKTPVAAYMVLAVDSPRPRKILQHLIDAHLAGDHLISVPTFGRKHGHPPIFDQSLLPELLAITEEKQGIREVIERHRAELKEIVIDSPLVLANLNTPDDYRRAKQLAGA